MYFILKITLFFISLIFLSCSKNDSPKDNATSGEITISIDESYKPIFEQMQDMFHYNYKYAKININYLPEQEAVNLLLQDSSRLTVVNRRLSKEEEQVFVQAKIIPRYTKIATDAVGIIVNNKRTDTLFTLTQISQMIKGDLNDWKQLNAKLTSSPIVLVFDKSGSSNFRFVVDTLGIKQSEIKSKIFAAGSNAEVIEYVNKNPDAIGFVGVAWISDLDSPQTQQFHDKIRVASVAKDTNSESFTKPYQAFIALKEYPLCRDIYVISREARMGLGTGFCSFVAGDKGQRIILKAGLVPAMMPMRIVKLKETK